MPHHKSCKKRLVTSRKRRERNRRNKGTVRSSLKAYRALPAGSEESQAQLPTMYSQLDVLARKGVMPRKRVSRLKRRLAAQATKTA